MSISYQHEANPDKIIIGRFRLIIWITHKKWLECIFLQLHIYLFDFLFDFIYPLFFQEGPIEIKRNLFFQGVLAKMAVQKVHINILHT